MRTESLLSCVAFYARLARRCANTSHISRVGSSDAKQSEARVLFTSAHPAEFNKLRKTSLNLHTSGTHPLRIDLHSNVDHKCIRNLSQKLHFFSNLQRMSYCGIHFWIMTLSGLSGIVSFSHFHNTRCLRRPKALRKILRFSSGKVCPLIMDPMLK